MDVVANNMVMVHEIPFPTEIKTTKPLSLLGYGITDMEIHFLQIKFTAIGVYLDPDVVKHVQQWKGKKGNELAEDDDFFDALISAPVEKYLRIVVIKEIKGSQYGVQLENVENENVVEMIKKWYLGGTTGASPSTISSLADNLSAQLSK
ncbi:hypothetical protein G4B88_029514 [Cannabis sativa]|uniref:Chalcone-flavonone isomerase family protein n=1 Tax=Cannabis sativa TaxID=3483 RepID=A0A7J6DUS9_CANSA|nr:hypothetical protein G4B88_029514 [Cannabis sativa]